MKVQRKEEARGSPPSCSEKGEAQAGESARASMKTNPQQMSKDFTCRILTR